MVYRKRLQEVVSIYKTWGQKRDIPGFTFTLQQSQNVIFPHRSLDVTDELPL